MKCMLMDNASKILIGYSTDIKGLDVPKYTENNKKYYEILLKNFSFEMEFKNYLTMKKETLNRRVSIYILNNQGKAIGIVNFYIHDKILYYKIGFPSDEMDLKLSGSLSDDISNVEFEIWEKWSKCLPKSKNEWAKLDIIGRRAWLTNARRYPRVNMSQEESPTNGTFYLDGTYMTDYPSFFCALGEAMNGPCGYYGYNISNLEDCLSGRFGPKVPFTLI